MPILKYSRFNHCLMIKVPELLKLLVSVRGGFEISRMKMNIMKIIITLNIIRFWDLIGFVEFRCRSLVCILFMCYILAYLQLLLWIFDSCRRVNFNQDGKT